jgi:BRCT domain type II-containing protein
MTEQVKQDKITIDGKDYIISDLPLELRNTIVARQEIQQSKVRHDIELEKISVLTEYYNEKIKKGLEEHDKSEK